MKKVHFHLFLVGLMAMFLGCNHEDERLLKRAEAYLPANPDSAVVYLDSIKQPERLDDAERAWYELLRTYADNRKGKEIKSDSLIRDCYEYYRDASHEGNTSDKTLLRHYAQSCYYMALFYSACDSTKQCEELLNQAIKGSEECEDWHTCYLAYTKLGKSTIWGNQEYAIQQSLKALSAYHKINDDVNNEILILEHLAADYYAFAELDSALNYFFSAYRLAEKNNLLKSHNEICIGIAKAYCNKGEYEKAINYAGRGMATADSTVLISASLTLAQCYQACDSLEKSKEILKSICQGANLKNKYFIYRNLSEVAIQIHDYDSLCTYVDSAYESLEERFLQSQHVKDEYYQDNLAKQIEKEKMQHETERNKWVLGSIIFFMIMFALFIYNVLRIRIVKERHKRFKHVTAQRLEHSKHLQDQKEKERIIAEHQKEIRHKQELLHQKSKTLAVLQKHLLEKLESARQLLTDNERARMTAEAWKEIEHLINDTDNNFVRNLRKQYGKFDEEDIQLCMLIRLKVTNAAIASVFHVGESAVKKRKSGLKKTGFQITDSDTTLEQVIENL